jgi:deoxyribonuclease I
MNMLKALVFCWMYFTLAAPVLAERPARPFSSFDTAKIVARDAIYAGHAVDFYCGCAFTPNKTGASGKINATACGYAPRKNKTRGQVLEWEHVVPAYFFGHGRVCWKTGNARCVKADGKAYKGRACCAKVDQTFQRIEADLHNLTPAVGELNGDRSNLRYGLVADEPRSYGRCDFEIGGKPKVTEPPANVRGDAARIWLYMSDTYGVKLTLTTRRMFSDWSKIDPVDRWERLRDIRIEAAQGNSNPFVQ